MKYRIQLIRIHNPGGESERQEKGEEDLDHKLYFSIHTDTDTIIVKPMPDLNLQTHRQNERLFSI